MSYSDIILFFVVVLFAIEKIVNIYHQHKLINKIMSGTYQNYVMTETKLNQPVVEQNQPIDNFNDPFASAYVGSP